MKFDTFSNELEQTKPSQKDHSMLKRTSVYSIILNVKHCAIWWSKEPSNEVIRIIIQIQLTILLI